MLAPSIPHHRGRGNEIRGNSRKDSFVRKLSKSSTTPLPALSLSFFASNLLPSRPCAIRPKPSQKLDGNCEDRDPKQNVPPQKGRHTN